MSRSQLTPPQRSPSLLDDLPPSSLLLLGVALAGIIAGGLYLHLRGLPPRVTPPAPAQPAPLAAPGPLWDCPDAASSLLFEPHEIALACGTLDVDTVGTVALVHARHRFEAGPLAPAEATYVMPMPHDAAVHGYRMCTPTGCVTGDLQEDEDARRTYEAAVEAGRTATLLDQRRDDTFALALGNVPRGGAIVIDLHWYQPLTRRDAYDELAIPMQDRPRFEGEPTADHPRDEPLPHDTIAQRALAIPVTIDVDSGGPIRAVTSPSHSETGTYTGVRRASMAFEASLPGDEITVRIARPEAHESALSWFVDTDEGSFVALDIGTPPVPADATPAPIDWVLVLDTSGSMRGAGIAQLQALTAALAERASADDTFTVHTFGSRAQTPIARQHVGENREGISRTLRRLDAGGGTYMTDGLLRAVRAPADPERQRVVLLVTDGAIGSHTSVLNAADAGESLAPIVAVGVGPSVHRDVLDDLAAWTGGYDDVATNDGDITRIVEQLLAVGRGALRELAINVGDASVEWATPLPRFVWPGTRTTLLGRIDAGLPDRVAITGRVGTSGHRAHVRTGTTTNLPDAVRLWWASERIDHLERRYHLASGSDASTFRDAVVGVSLREGLASSFTSFVAVGDAARAPHATAAADDGLTDTHGTNDALIVARGAGGMGMRGTGRGGGGEGFGAVRLNARMRIGAGSAVTRSASGRGAARPQRREVRTIEVEQPQEEEQAPSPEPAAIGSVRGDLAQATTHYEITAPPSAASVTLDFEHPTVDGAADATAVEQALERQGAPLLERCFELEVAAQARLSLPLSFELVFEVDADGRASAAVVRDVPVDDVATCLEAALTRVRFVAGAPAANVSVRVRAAAN